MKTATPAPTAKDVLRAAHERRQEAWEVLQELAAGTSKTDHEAARQAYNAATDALDRLAAGQCPVFFK